MSEQAETKDELSVIGYCINLTEGTGLPPQWDLFKKKLTGNAFVQHALTDHATATSKLAELQRKVEGLRKDAERWRQARKLARYYPSPDGGDYLAFDSLPWPRSCHATTPEYADAAIDASLSSGRSGSGDGGMG